MHWGEASLIGLTELSRVFGFVLLSGYSVHSAWQRKRLCVSSSKHRPKLLARSPSSAWAERSSLVHGPQASMLSSIEHSACIVEFYTLTYGAHVRPGGRFTGQLDSVNLSNRAAGSTLLCVRRVMQSAMSRRIFASALGPVARATHQDVPPRVLSPPDHSLGRCRSAHARMIPVTF
ncbi:hypothetical protein OH77DRAFT_970503 [Trametes cingulata]|nr:hypothetical protein OH77DRAFT_970503 [Trametes cingulata]